MSRISRDLNPNITNFRDLNQEVFLLAAIGGLSGRLHISMTSFLRVSVECRMFDQSKDTKTS